MSQESRVRKEKKILLVLGKNELIQEAPSLSPSPLKGEGRGGGEGCYIGNGTVVLQKSDVGYRCLSDFLLLSFCKLPATDHGQFRISGLMRRLDRVWQFVLNY